MKARWPLLIAFVLAACADSATAPAGVRTYKALSAGGDHTCAIADDNAAYCWGSSAHGELGTGKTAVSSETPGRVVGNLAFAQISAGDDHTCALTSDGQAYCWGWNLYFQRGNATDPRDSEPVPVSSTVRFRSISAGAQHTCAIGVDSLAYCWGFNRFGQVGDNTTNQPVAPGRVNGDLKFVEISAGGAHTCARTAIGTVYCWGSNEFGQLGIGRSDLNALTPQPLNTILHFVQLSAGRTHTCAISTDQRAWCWGSNEYGELGNGTALKPGLAGASSPAAVSSALPTVQSISTGTNLTCALATSGETYCWGRGDLGQLGNGTMSDAYEPQRADIPSSTLTSLAVGGRTHACALVNRNAFCWGSGRVGQLGFFGGRFTVVPTRVND